MQPTMTPMQSNRMTLFVPVLVIALGCGWLLSALGVAPQIDWAWSIGLAVVGVLTLAVGGFDKATVVVGPFFLVASCLSVLRQAGYLHLNVEVPVLVIVAGVLLLVARSPAVPPPRWILPADQGTGGGTTDAR